MLAVSVSPTRTVPLMVGAPVAGELGRAATVAVGALSSASPLPASSVKLTRTLMVLPASSSAGVYVEPVAPGMSEPSADHR